MTRLICCCQGGGCGYPSPTFMTTDQELQMPNHITNIITAEPAALAQIFTLLKSDKQKVDFNKLIPMPADVLATVSKQLNMQEMALTNGRNWYDWCAKEWNTKWNAYDIDVSPNAINFDTAWACPEPVMRKLHQMLPYIDWEWSYADEDIGHNCGTWKKVGGTLAHIEPSDPARFGCEIKGHDHDEYMAEGL